MQTFSLPQELRLAQTHGRSKRILSALTARHPARTRSGSAAIPVRQYSLRTRASAAVAERTPTLQKIGSTQEVPAYKGKAVEVAQGQYLKVINTPGTQVVDFFAMNKDTAKDGYLREIMSMHHSRDSTKKLIPAVGDVMVTSRRKPILTIIEESGPGVHDTVYAACNHELYEQLLGIKPEEFHNSCTNNLHTSLGQIGWKLTDDPEFYLTPAPFNLWMAGPFDPKGNLAPIAELPPPAEGQKAGDYIIMRAEMNCVCVMSACPADDITEINGEGGTQAVHYEILELS